MLTATILNWDGVSLGRVYAGWLGGGGCFMVGHCLLLDTNCIHPGEFPIGSYLKVKGSTKDIVSFVKLSSVPVG